MWFEDDTYEDFGSESDDSSEYYYVDNDDHYYMHSESDSDNRDLHENFRCEDVKRPRIDAKDSKEDQKARPETLEDICSRFVALNFPFAYIESWYPPVPDVLQRKIISFSFPENEAVIEKYAKLGQNAINFEYPRKLCSNGAVTNMRQIGFRLSATVKGSLQDKSFHVAIYFDRGKITSAYCSCEAQRSWCNHVIAVIFQRIHHKSEANIQSKVPISDSLNALSKEKLLKFAQYLLCEHKNEPVIETAQILLDKLLLPEKNVEDGEERFEDINKIHGAPDPTAGPGWEDESCWFVCNEGFKSRCQDIKYESFTDLGFTKIGDFENRRGYECIHDLWLESYGGKQLQMRDNMEKELSFESFNYGHSKSYRHNRTLKLFEILETIEELLQGDVVTGISLLSSCTEEVITKLERTSRDRDSITDLPSIKSNLVNTTPTTSLAMGFTPRPFSCWTFLDEISRLWRLVTLNPYLPPKHRQELLKTFASWRSRVTTGCFRAHLVPWLGLEVADALGQLEWNHSDIKAVCEGRQLCQPNVCSYTAVRVSEEIRQENKCSLDALSLFNLPSQICFGSEAIDILTCCSLVDALNLCKDNLSAVRLSLHVAVSLITHFKEEISIGKGSLDLPIVEDVTLDSKENVQKEETSEKKLPMETDSYTGQCGWKKTKCEIWPQATVLSVTTFAFLYDVMSKNRCILESCINEAKSQGKTVEQLNNMDSVDSLLFQLGVVGLMVPRFPSASSCGEVEQWQHENWLTSQLVNAKLTENDIELLLQISYFVYQRQWWFSAPPISLARVSFYHLFKDAVGSLNGELTERNEIGLKLALYFLETSKLFQAISIGWAMFQYATYRHWSKLVGLVLDYLSGFPEYLDKAVEHVLHEGGFLGTRDGRHSDQIKSANLTLETLSWFEESRNDMQARIAFSLAKVLSSKSRPSLEADVYKAIETSRDKLPKKFKDAESRLCICVIKLGARGALLGKNSKAIGKMVRQEFLRWLISFAVKCSEDGIKCLMACDGGVTHFMSKDEILDFCASLVEEKEESLHVYARDILMNEVDTEMLQSGTSHRIQQIFTFCRERRSVRKSNVLLWICRKIQERAYQREVPFDVLFEASEALFDLFKEENRKEVKNRRSDVFQPSLARLYDEILMEEEENVSDSQLMNPYMTPETHPFLQLAYDLGLLAVESVQRHSHCEVEVLSKKKYGRSKGIKQFLCDFSRIVCYVVKKSWLKSESEDPARENLPQTNEYLERFVLCLSNSVENPCWLFAVLEKMAEMLKGKHVDEDSISYPEENSVLTACSKYNVLQVLLEQCLGAFSKLLTGPRVEKKLKDLESLHDRNEERLESQLRTLYLYSDMRLEDVFKSAKRAFSVLDHSKNAFEELLHDIETRHSWIKVFLDDNIRNDSNQRNVRSFPLEAVLLHRYLFENLIEQML